MTEGAARLDLAGAPAGEVTAADAQHAKQLANRRRSNAIRSRKQEAGKPVAEELDKPAADEQKATADSVSPEPSAPEATVTSDHTDTTQIGRASCRERVGQYG